MSHSHPCVLVTGAASGIGKAVLETLIQDSTRVVALDHNALALESLRSHYADHDAKPHFVCADLGHDDLLADKLAPHLAEVTALAHCAGVWVGGSVLETSPDQWAFVLRNNLQATQNICGLVAPRLRQAQHGQIVIVSSNAARMPRLDMSAYCVSKAAVSMYAKCLALELAPHGVRCNVVSPGATATPMQAQYQNFMQQSSLDNPYRIPAPLAGSSQPRDIANIVSFLLSPRANSLTMADLCADRGATLGV